MEKSYTTITETPDIGASREQLSMLYTRYRFAAPLCGGKDVLEVACGAGMGLGYLARFAKRVVGGDIDDQNLRLAVEHYRGRPNIQIRNIDAHRLPFEDGSFDVVLLYEAIYYLDRPDRFLEECRRVLREKGAVLICTVNNEWPDFNPSPYSMQYYSSRELRELLSRHRFDVELYGAFPFRMATVKDSLISYIKRAAVALHLIPKTMKGKEALKRIFFGELIPLPPEVEDGMANYASPVLIHCDAPNTQYKVIYAIARVP